MRKEGNMIHRRFENTDLDLSAITFGAWAIGGWMWGGADRKDALDALAAAIDSGITTIDTAPVYGFGLSEQIVGEAIKCKRNHLQIITKYGLRWNGEKGQFHFSTKSPDGKPIEINRCSKKSSILEECEESLKNLGTDHIDLYIMHWPDNTLPMQEPMEAMEALVKQGKIRYAGLSNCDASMVEEVRKYFPIVTDQVPYSMVNRDVEKELIPWCIKNHVGILAYSPLQRGILTGKMKVGHTFGEDDSRPNTPFY